jgi:hypothetical protein
VFRIVTDNASSMMKAYKFGLIVADSDSLVQNNNERQDYDHVTEYPDDNDFSTLGEWVLVDWCDNEKPSFDSNEHIPIRLSCYAHSLQLAIRDGLRQTPYLSRSLSKCIQLARKSYKSTKITDILEDVGKTISRSNLTRWSSEYLLIKSIVELERKTIDEITDIIDDDELKFNNNDFIALKEACEILEPFAEITSRIQSESVVTVSLVVPSIVHIIDHLNNIKPHLSLLTNICEQLEQSMNKRFAGIVKHLSHQNVSINDPFSDPLYFISAVLDPEFKFYWLTQMNNNVYSESQMKQSLIQMVLNECQQGINRSLNNEEHTQQSSTSLHSSNDSIRLSSRMPDFKKRKLFHYDNDTSSSLKSTMSPIHEINAYLNDPTRLRFSTYWKNSQFSHLKSVVKRIFSVQASSAPIERVFSQAGAIMSPRRTTMLEEVFRSLVFLRVNQQLL